MFTGPDRGKRIKQLPDRLLIIPNVLWSQTLSHVGEPSAPRGASLQLTAKRSASEFIDQVHLLVRLKGWRESSGILFGSHAMSATVPDSDVDLVVVVPDSAEEGDIEIFRRQLAWLNQKVLSVNQQKGAGMGAEFIRAVECRTGQFVSGFVCKRNDFLLGRFSVIFGVNRLLSLLMAPKSLVLRNLHRSYRVLWGEDLLRGKEIPTPTTSEIAGTIVMNILQVCGAIALLPLLLIGNERGTARRYVLNSCLEAMKWSIHSCSAWKAAEPSSEGFAEQLLCTPNLPKIIGQELRVFLELRKSREQGPLSRWTKKEIQFIVFALPTVLLLPRAALG